MPAKKVPYDRLARGTFSEMISMGLSAEACFLMIYFLISDQRKMSGYFRLPIPYITADTRLDEAKVSADIDELTAAGLIQYDHGTGFIAIVDCYRHDPIGSYKNGRSVLSAWASMEKCGGDRVIKGRAMERSANAILENIMNTNEPKKEDAALKNGVRVDAKALLAAAHDLLGINGAEGAAKAAPQVHTDPCDGPDHAPSDASPNTQRMPTTATSSLDPASEGKAKVDPDRPPSPSQMAMLERVARERGTSLAEVQRLKGLPALTAEDVTRAMQLIKEGDLGAVRERLATEQRNQLVRRCRELYSDEGAETAREWVRQQEPTLQDKLMCQIQTFELEAGFGAPEDEP